MFFYNKVERYERPISILEREKCDYTPTLMNRGDLSFLCGMIKKFRPKKVVEVGVAYGGTTAVIINCLAELNCKCEMHSIDILKSFRGDKPGAFLNVVKDHIDFSNITHKFYLGKPAPYFLDEIGGDIDFLILDTSHGLPGELLEFITFMPYLTENAVVVLHDVVDHVTWKDNSGYEYATQLLFDCVVADKYLIGDEERRYSYPNIAAFVINEDTRKYIGNCFGAMNMTWLYIPDEEQYSLYLENIRKNYGKEYVDLLELSRKLNMIHFDRKHIKKRQWIQRLWNNKIFIYGAGDIGRNCKKLLNNIGIDECGFVISDNQIIDKSKTENIFYISEVEKEDKLFIIAVGDNWISEIRDNLEKKDIFNYLEWGELLQII